MTLQPLTFEEAQTIREYRNTIPECLRTAHGISEIEQAQWYKNVAANPKSRARWWGIHTDDEFIGYAGIENIQWESSIGEISIIILPDYQCKGHGRIAVYMVLDEAFNRMNLKTVCGECYRSNPGLGFWFSIVEGLEAFSTWLPNRKYIFGRYWDSYYFSIDRDLL